MTKERFRKQVVVVLVYNLALTAVLIALDPKGDWVLRVRNALPLLIALPAAWLVECFRRRKAYNDEVSDLYKTVVEDVQCALRYTRRRDPTASEYYDALQKLSCSIDKLRAHFKNYKFEDYEPGLYPVEGLKTTYAWIEHLGGGEGWLGEKTANDTRSAILFIWQNKIREPLLSELKRIELTKRASPYLGDEDWRAPPSKAFAEERQI